MDAQLQGEEIENVDDNPCFGCGPANESGLHLRFFDDGDVVRAQFTPDERLAGWPGSINAGFTFLAMMEACSWALWQHLGPSMPASDVTVQMRAPNVLGKPIVVEARVEPDEVSGVRATMTALQEGRETAAATMHARRPSPEEARVMAPRVPAALRDRWEAVARGEKKVRKESA